jgi:hypothetical protein
MHHAGDTILGQRNTNDRVPVVPPEAPTGRILHLSDLLP